MNITCEMAEDLLPLYLEGTCSADSRAALEAHLHICPTCREKRERMERNIPTLPKQAAGVVPLSDCTRRIRRHRLRTAGLVLLLSVLSVCILTMCLLAVDDMRRQANPTVFPVEDGVWNLTAGELETTTETVGEYVLFTNSTRISVTAAEDSGYEGEILLWDAEKNSSPILYGHVDERGNTCVFENLTSARYYRITCEGGANVSLTISEGRVVSFWHSLGTVVNTLLGR